MGGCASRPKESDMNNEEGYVPSKQMSETVVAKENNTEESGEKQNQSETETTETTSFQGKETSQVEPTKEAAHAAEPEVATVEESSSACEATPAASEKVEKAAVSFQNSAADVVAVAAPEKVDVTVAEPVKEESKKEEKEAVVTV